MAKKNAFQWRAMVSTLMALTFLALAVSGILLFVAPPGRVANWTDWRILGLTKHMWGGLHIWFATLFLGLTAVHLYFNFRPLMSYLRKRRGQASKIRLEWVSSTVVALVLFVGTSAAVPPFVSYLEWQETIKNSWEKPTERAPIPHAEELTLRELAGYAKIDPATALARLGAAGLENLTAASITADVAEANGISAQDIYDLLDPVHANEGRNAMGTGRDHGDEHGAESSRSGGGAGGGMGWKTLVAFCALEDIPLATAMERLEAAGITAEKTQTLRDIAQNSGYEHPYEILEILRGTQTP
jgi:hypothetical protein